MDRVDQHFHGRDYLRKVKQRASFWLMDASSYPDQLALMQESLQSNETAEDIAGRMGLDVKSYLESCRSAITFQEQIKTEMTTQYSYSEIRNQAR